MLTQFKKSVDPVNPQAGESYFATCERDDEGHCLPKGESEEHSQEEKSPKDFKEASERAIEQLSKEGKDAIAFYTSQGYYEINTAMRKCPPKYECVDKSLLKKAYAINSAIQLAGKFPEPVEVLRGLRIVEVDIREKFIKQLESIHASGGEFQWPTLASTTVNPDVVETFTSEGTFGILFKIKAKSGLYVESASVNPHEKELIQSWKTRYKIKNIEVTPKGNRVVIMEEI